MTNDASKPDGVKHKRLTQHIDGGVRFEGELYSENGAPCLDRTTLTPHGDGCVRQLIEISTDGGKTWRATFDGYYARNLA